LLPFGGHSFPFGVAMRKSVSFTYPAKCPSLSYENAYDGILAVDDAQWFVSLLRRVPGLQIDGKLCQEDWGVVVFVERSRKRFWIGLSPWTDSNDWQVHAHHGSFAWLQRFSSSGNAELKRLVSDLHDVLAVDPLVSAIHWYEEREMSKADPRVFPTPTNR
jgi:hypothetical protein